MFELSRLFFGLSVLACCYSLALLAGMYWTQSGWVLLLGAHVLGKRLGGVIVGHLAMPADAATARTLERILR